MPLLWKFLREGMKSEYGDCVWKVGEWKKEDRAEKCSKGFHASENILDALRYVQGEVLARVEVRGECDKDDTKQAWTEMRIKKAYKWTKAESIKLAIFAAYSVLDIYEKQYPNDKRPRLAIEAAEKYVADPNDANQNAAEDAAEDAAEAAEAAETAAYAAYGAAYAAASAAARAAYGATPKKIEKYLRSRINELEEIK